MKTFDFYKHIKREVINTLTKYGQTPKEILKNLKIKMPYLFASKKECELNDKKYI